MSSQSNMQWEAMAQPPLWGFNRAAGPVHLQWKMAAGTAPATAEGVFWLLRHEEG